MSLVCTQLLKTYPRGGFSLGPLTFTIPEGQTVAILGKNGSGKTTLFDILAGQRSGDKGRVEWNGVPLAPQHPESKKYLGYVPQNLFLPRWASVEDILSYTTFWQEGSTQEVKRQLELWDLKGVATKPVNLCSLGTQKRLGISIALASDPELLLMDEPFTALDIAQVKTLETMVAARKQRGKTTVLSTHTALNAARLCDQVFLVEKGSLKSIPAWATLDFLGKIDFIEGLFADTPSG